MWTNTQVLSQVLSFLFLQDETHGGVESIISLSNEAKKNKPEDNCGKNVQRNNKGNLDICEKKRTHILWMRSLLWKVSV